MKIKMKTRITLSDPYVYTDKDGVEKVLYEGLISGRTWNPKKNEWMSFAKVRLSPEVYNYLKKCEDEGTRVDANFEIDSYSGMVIFD